MKVCVRAIQAIALMIGLTISAHAKPAPGYEKADSVFSSLKQDTRVFLEVLMTAAGYYNSVPLGSFNSRLFNGTKQFQVENGFSETGFLDSPQLDRLYSTAAKKFDQWGFERIKHPSRRVAIWVPVGLGLISKRTSNGIEWRDPDKRLSVYFNSLSNMRVADDFAALMNVLADKGAKIHYKVQRRDWFVVSFTTAGGADAYARYHQDDTSVTGFTLFWNNANGDVNGDRIATLMSGSLWSAMLNKPFPPVPGKNLSAAKTTNITPSDPKPPAKPKQETKEPRAYSGTGFFVSNDGSLVTNAHVVEKCDLIMVKTSEGAVEAAKLVNTDSTNDLALLKTSVSPKGVAKFRIGTRLGEGIAAFGYPHSELLSSSGNFTLGNVTALTGMGDDSRYFQISAPVQAGNSGGPLLDTSGNVVGVVSAKLNALKLALQAGDLPQNVNFAVKAAILATFLSSNSLAIQSGSVADKPLDPADLADRAKEMSAFVLCGGL